MSEFEPPVVLNFESALEQLQSAVKRLESGELPLEQALRQFEDGVRLTRACQEYLSAAEQRVELLIRPTTQPSEENIGIEVPKIRPFAEDKINLNS